MSGFLIKGIVSFTALFISACSLGKNTVPTLFGTDISYANMNESEVNMIDGVIDYSDLDFEPKCTKYALVEDPGSLSGERQIWIFSKDTHELVGYVNEVHVTLDEFDKGLEILSNYYGKASDITPQGEDVRPYVHKWLATNNKKLRDDGIHKIELRIWPSYRLISQSIEYLDRDKVCRNKVQY